MNIKDFPGETTNVDVEALASGEDIRSIGELIRDSRDLTAEQVQQILEYQRSNGVRFGEAAIALGYATPDDVLRALSLQFNYAYGSPEKQKASPELIAFNQPFSAQAEAIRAVRAQLLMRMQPEEGPGAPHVKRAVAVVSPHTGDGKTFFCANLAVSLAQLGGRTLVVDADMRGPRLHEVLDIKSDIGLSGLLMGRRGEGVIKSVRGVRNLYALPVGVAPPNPQELVEGPAFGLLLHELMSRFDHVLVDTPAAQYGVDGAVVAGRCGAALVVARRGKVRVDAMQELVDNLAAANSRVAGVVINDF